MFRLPIHRYGPCIGITLFRFRRRQVELWYSPADYATPEHSHEHSDGEFLILWARNRRIWRKTHTLRKDGTLTIARLKRHFDEIGPGDEYVANAPPWKFKTLSVRAGIKHGFDKGSSPMVWLCFEKWKPGVQVTSVADDFQMAPMRVELFHALLRNEAKRLVAELNIETFGLSEARAETEKLIKRTNRAPKFDGECRDMLTNFVNDLKKKYQTKP